MTPAGPWSVCVYCASSTRDETLLRLAADTGRAVAARGWTLVSGGGNVSMMGEAVRAARAAGGRTVGVIPGRLVDREVADTDSDELVVVDTMRARKREMEERSDAFLVLPGGIGTLEEMFEMWTSAALGFHSAPVVLCDPVGHYAPLLDWLHGLVDGGMVKAAAFDRLVVTTDVDEALDACRGPVAP